MSRSLIFLFFFLAMALPGAGQKNAIGGQVLPIKGGSFVPLYGSDTQPVKVEPFLLDKYPVTNAEYQAFLKAYPKWNKGSIKRIFSDQNYLKHWTAGNTMGPESGKISNSPVINVSWFAAKAYCECQGKRLPTTNEWEFAALASENKPDATNDTKFYQRSLEWYSKPNPKFLPPVQESFRNYYGVQGMIGLVWEWTQDYNSTMLVGEGRSNASLDKQEFCGSGASGATNVKNYVAFMRYAFRSSLKANYTVGNLGFRCAQSNQTASR